jgi:hypothetical protein
MVGIQEDPAHAAAVARYRCESGKSRDGAPALASRERQPRSDRPESTVSAWSLPTLRLHRSGGSRGERLVMRAGRVA